MLGKADAACLVALLLHRHVEPILLLHRVAFTLVVTGGVTPLGLLPRGVTECFAHDDSTRSAGGSGEGIAVGES